MATGFPEAFTAAASDAIELPDLEILTGLLQVPAEDALVTAWISGVALFDSQTATAVPLGQQNSDGLKHPNES